MKTLVYILILILLVASFLYLTRDNPEPVNQEPEYIQRAKVRDSLKMDSLFRAGMAIQKKMTIDSFQEQARLMANKRGTNELYKIHDQIPSNYSVPDLDSLGALLYPDSLRPGQHTR